MVRGVVPPEKNNGRAQEAIGAPPLSTLCEDGPPLESSE